MYKPARLARYCGGASSTRSNGDAVCAHVAKKDSKNLPKMKIFSVFAVLVTIVPTQTPMTPMKM